MAEDKRGTEQGTDSNRRSESGIESASPLPKAATAAYFSECIQRVRKIANNLGISHHRLANLLEDEGTPGAPSSHQKVLGGNRRPKHWNKFLAKAAIVFAKEEGGREGYSQAKVEEYRSYIFGTDETEASVEGLEHSESLISKRFFTPTLTKKPDVLPFVERRWSIEAAECHEHSLDLDVQKEIRNSFRWRIVHGDSRWLLREILRKMPADRERVESKNELLAWLQSKGFPTIAPLKETSTATRDEGGSAFELSEYLTGGRDYNPQYDDSAKLIELLVEIQRRGHQISQYEPDLEQRLQTRFDRYLQWGKPKEWTKDRCDQVRSVLSGKTEFLHHIEPILKSLHDLVRDEKLTALEERANQEPNRLIHGDMTFSNVRVFGDSIYLFDWDTSRLLPSGHFDAAFAAVRLVFPINSGRTHLLTEQEVQKAKRFIDDFCKAAEDLGDAPTKETIALGLEEVSLEFCLRMDEYLTLLAEDPTVPVVTDYLSRCNPYRPLELRDRLNLR